MMLLNCVTARAAIAVRAGTVPAFSKPSRFVTAFIAGLPLLVVPAGALSPSPHEMTFRALSDTALRIEMDPSSQQLGTIRRGTGGIRLNWCEPDIPYQAWQTATPQEQRALLDGRWCEVEADGMVGNVEARMLTPG